MSDDDPYAVLGVEPTADMAQVRRAYLAQLRRNHPDLRPGDAVAEERTRDLNRAWELVRTRRAGPAAIAPTRAPRPARRSQPAYSGDRSAFRLAFTTATLRVALTLIAVGVVLLALFAR